MSGVIAIRVFDMVGTGKHYVSVLTRNGSQWFEGNTALEAAGGSHEQGVIYDSIQLW
jgi:hypothetical protein